jgi:hypothetical protein
MIPQPDVSLPCLAYPALQSRQHVHRIIAQARCVLPSRVADIYTTGSAADWLGGYAVTQITAAWLFFNVLLGHYRLPLDSTCTVVRVADALLKGVSEVTPAYRLKGVKRACKLPARRACPALERC